MFEIEAKVRLSESDFKRLKKDIPKIAKKEADVISKDSYYSNSKNFSLRIREKNKYCFLNLKSKKRGEGIELNQEIEIPLKSVSKFDAFLKKIGIKLSAKKEKKGEIFRMGDMQIELHNVKKLGYFLEIETIVKTKSQIPKAKKSLLETFRKLGFKSSDFEKKYYLELLYG
jgi:predicted adenylyl cyclase CyaB